MPQVLVNGVPLDQSQFEDSFEEAVVMEVLKQTSTLQQAVYKVRDQGSKDHWGCDSVCVTLEAK